MPREVKLSHVEEVLTNLEYPITPTDVERECDEVTILLADGTENLGALVGESSEDQFESPDELMNELFNLLPSHAVGEPGQSEGEG